MAKKIKQVIRTDVYIHINEEDNQLIKIKDNLNDTKGLKLSDDGIDLLAKLFVSNVLKTDIAGGGGS